jgi:prevent-host-death family protein
MATFDIDEAKAALSKLIDDALAGQETVISRNGVEIIRLVPIPPPVQHGPRIPGRSKGKIWIAPDFDLMSDDEIADWEGR